MWSTTAHQALMCCYPVSLHAANLDIYILVYGLPHMIIDA
jgi:hypothetical protein